MAYSSVKTDLIPQKTIEEIVEIRNKTIQLYTDGFNLMEQADKTATTLFPYSGITFYKTQKVAEIVKLIDVKTWRHIFNVSGMDALMNSDQKSEFEDQMQMQPPEITVESVHATLVTLHSCRADTFIEGAVATFKKLNKNYKSNQPFKLGHKSIFAGASCNGYWSSFGTGRDEMVDLEKIVYIINKLPPPTSSERIDSQLHNIIGTTDTKEFKFLTCKTFKNGNIHLIIKCKKTVDRINEMIANHYGTV